MTLQTGPFQLYYADYISETSHCIPDSKVRGTNMGPIWGRQDPDGPHVGPMNFAIWATTLYGESSDT